jgi:hypothetical protein
VRRQASTAALRLAAALISFQGAVQTAQEMSELLVQAAAGNTALLAALVILQAAAAVQQHPRQVRQVEQVQVIRTRAAQPWAVLAAAAQV